MQTIPPEFRDLFGARTDTNYFAAISDGVTKEDSSTLNQARLFYDNQLNKLCLEKRNQPLPANGLILANASSAGAGEAGFYTEARLRADEFPTIRKARLVYHFDNGKPLADAQEYNNGFIANPNIAEKSQSFEVHDLIKTYFDDSGEGGKNKVWDMIKDAVS